ncbi:MAG: zinc-binding dehydrogenase [Spirochaetes bacterium]|nr:zinc-binding dehydrogenase [Spirochaetota bacterium]
MKAVVKYAKGKGFVEVRDVPEPQPGPGEVRIRVEYAGICASDLHILNDDIAITIRPPVVMGHEFSGTIDRLGDGVEGWSAGDRVVAEASYEVCGACRYCASGFYNLCGSRKVLGYWHDGAFARYTVVPARRLHRLPAGISFKAGALIEPTACVVHGVCELITIGPHDVVLVTGPGAIGLTALQVAKAAGATVVVSGTADDRARLELAAKLGADATVDVSTGDLAKTVHDLTAGRGVDVVVECAGNDRAVRSALDALRKQGQFLQLGLLGRDMQLAFDAIVYKELKVTGSLSSRDVSWRRAIELVERGDVRPEVLVSGEYPLDDWEEAFRMHAGRKGLKILFKPE